MVRLALEGESLEKRQQAIKNCVVLTREAPSAKKLIEQNAIVRLAGLLRDPNEEIRVHALHFYGGLAELGSEVALLVLPTLQQTGVYDSLLACVRCQGQEILLADVMTRPQLTRLPRLDQYPRDSSRHAHFYAAPGGTQREHALRR